MNAAAELRIDLAKMLATEVLHRNGLEEIAELFAPRGTDGTFLYARTAAPSRRLYVLPLRPLPIPGSVAIQSILRVAVRGIPRWYANGQPGTGTTARALWLANGPQAIPSRQEVEAVLQHPLPADHAGMLAAFPQWRVSPQDAWRALGLSPGGGPVRVATVAENRLGRH